MFHIQTVWVWDTKSEKAYKRTLIIRKDRNKTKFSLSNFDVKERTIEEFAYMQRQRYWIERSFQENIGELGMTEYQGKEIQFMVSSHGFSDDGNASYSQKAARKKGRYTTSISKRYQATNHCITSVSRRNHGR